MHKPRITQVKTLATSRLFEIQAVDLLFSNGSTAQYERVCTQLAGAVCVAAIENNEVLLIREYQVGTDRYELVLPKGAIDMGEEVLSAANRELMEETGHGAKSLQLMKVMAVAPGYFNHRTHLVLATGLYPQSAEGDEPEPLEVVRWSLD
ncbi:MAG: ADP compounds hydrolase NudE, partial [Granulosicoccaceae bacterium]